jgi:amidohydrolase
MTIPSSDIEEAVRWRRHLHSHPEIAFEERETQRFIAERLTEFGLEVHQGLAGTGVVGTLSRGRAGKRIGIRSDIDALPILEDTQLAYASRVPGKMHACGHDGHMSMLLLAAQQAARRDDIAGTIHFIFQPAEETEGGGRKMVEDGLFRQFPCDEIYGLHNWPALDVGACVARDDAMMAAFGTFEIEIVGRGAHGAMPHEGADPIVAAGELIGALQTIASRNVSPLLPAVVSVTQVHGGDALNVIPERVVLRGTTRWFEDAVGDLIEARMEKVARTIADGLGCKAKLTYERRYPATINSRAQATFMRDVARDIGLDVRDALPSMAAEDFSFMLREVPGAYLWLGARRPGENPGLHSPRFDFNDEVLPQGAALWSALIARAAA